MNSWKEAPHLFANGKFKMAYNEENFECDIWAYHHPDEFHLFDIEADQSDFIALKDCTLIARKISDMSDEEMKKTDCYKFSSGGVELARTFLEAAVNEGRLSANDLFVMLKSGVYPFKNHNDIIWRYENTNR